MRSGANSGRDGRSRLPRSPRSSTAEYPFVCAKSRIFDNSHAGQPRVENASGKRSAARIRKRLITRLAAPAAKKSRRLIFIGSFPLPPQVLGATDRNLGPVDHSPV